VRPRVAILPWGDAIEDFLDPLGLTLEAFRDELAGGWLFGYVEALRRAGVDATVVCCAHGVRSTTRWRHAPSGAPLRVLPSPRAARAPRGRALRDPYPAYLATPPALLAREARRGGWRALLVQEYDSPRFDVCTAVGRLLGIPVFATFQGGYAPSARLERVLRPRTLRAAAGLVIASRAEAERVRVGYGVRAERIEELPNPLELELWSRPRDPARRAALGVPADAVVVAWHGRVDVARKGLDVLLDAWGALAARPGLPRRHLLLVGTGADAEALRGRLAGLEDITWVDRYVLDKPEVAAMLAAADLYAFPSRHEGFPVAPLEAMASGLPVVAADAPGVAEILPGGAASGGVVVPVGDAAAFAAALARLLGDPGERERLGTLARARAEAFSLDAVGARLRRVLLREG
jgi:glycosyltransferase involved in cell wall biosynthesis